MGEMHIATSIWDKLDKPIDNLYNVTGYII